MDYRAKITIFLVIAEVESFEKKICFHGIITKNTFK